MTTWVMQYRTRLNDTDEWEKWKDLPEALIYSSYYAPLYFQFRAMPQEGKRAFVFHGTSINEASLLA